MEAPLIETRGLQKWYSGVHALKNVDFKVSKGEVVGLVGDNGAGKTTLIKILSGVHPPDGGEIRIEGRKVDIETPRQAMSLGIETIYQTNSMVPTMSIARNLFIGREPLRASIFGFGFMDQGRMRRDSVKAIADVDLHLRSPDALVGELSGGQRQGVAIARAHQPPFGQGDGQGHRLRQGAEEPGRNRHLHQPQHAPGVPVLRPGGRHGARRDRLQ
jgi:simple sugar transport system ATP-binding protein